MSQTFRTPLLAERNAIWFWPDVVGPPVVNCQVLPEATLPGSSSRATTDPRETVYVVCAASGAEGVKTRTRPPGGVVCPAPG